MSILMSVHVLLVNLYLKIVLTLLTPLMINVVVLYVQVLSMTYYRLLNCCLLDLDCSIEGQIYKTSETCSRTCTILHLHCTIDCVPGCSCPNGQVIDEDKGHCVYF